MWVDGTRMDIVVGVTKTTMQNKVHFIAEEISDIIYTNPKSSPYLFIEVVEDHVTEQHGKTSNMWERKQYTFFRLQKNTCTLEM